MYLDRFWTPFLLLIEHVPDHCLEGPLEHGQGAEPLPPLGDGVVRDEEPAEEELERQESRAQPVALRFRWAYQTQVVVSIGNGLSMTRYVAFVVGREWGG